jgi:hypothetical protein
MMIGAWTIIGAVTIGLLGFLIGYIGPIIFYPNSNQGPLFGIFLTGPMGVLGGAIVGCIVGVIRNRKARRAEQKNP